MKPQSFTEREVQYLQLLAEGWTQVEIARKDGKNLCAVNRTIQRSFDKLGATNSVSAVASAIARGMITNPFDELGNFKLSRQASFVARETAGNLGTWGPLQSQVAR